MKSRSRLFRLAASVVLAFLVVSLAPLARGGATTVRAEEPRESEEGEELLRREEYWSQRNGALSYQEITAARNYSKASLPQTGTLPNTKSAKKQSGVQPNAPLPPTNGWQLVGPSPISTGFAGSNQAGRVAAIAVDKTTSGANQVIYAGAANGGVWKTTNNGALWSPTSDTQDVLAIGSLAIDPTNSQIVYAGTGEGFKGCLDCYRGSGVLKSTNGGGSWTLYGTTTFGSRNGSLSRILVNPLNTQEIWGSSSIGLAKSSDGGVNWTIINGTGGLPAGTIQVDDVRIDASVSPARLFATFRNNGLYKSTDGGVNWTKLVTGLPASGVFANRSRLAISPSTPSVVYMVIVNSGGAAWSSTFNGGYWTTDGGTTWNSMLAMNSNFSGSQGWYDLELEVDPLNDSTVYFSGIDIFVSTNARGTAANGAYRNISNVYTSPNAGGIHPDQHGLAFAACAAAPCRLYASNDGGVFYTDNSTSLPGSSVVYTNLNTVGFAIAEFIGGDIGPNFSASPLALGGTQDNGTMKYTGSQQWPAVIGGDGGFARINWQNPNTVYHTFYSQQGLVSLERSDNGGANWYSASTGINSSNGTLFYTPYILDRNAPNHMLVGTDRVNESLDGGISWHEDSLQLVGGLSTNRYVSALGISPLNSSIMYAGTNNGALFKTTGGNNYGPSTWTDVTSNLPALPSNIWFTQFYFDPTDVNTVYVSGGRFYRANGAGFLYKTTDGGASWTNILGNLPNLPLNYVIGYESTAGKVLVISNDIGVFYSMNDGVSWTWLNVGMPNTAVYELALDPAQTTLLAFTHGRSVWKMSLPQGPAATSTPGPSPTASNTPTTIPSLTPTATPTNFYCNGVMGTATFDRADSLTTTDGRGNFYYRVLPFTVSTTGAYTLFMTNANLTNGSDGFYNLYQNSFNPANSLTNIIAFDDDGGNGFGSPSQPRIAGITLTAGTQYILVATAFDPLQSGTFTDSITGPGTVSASCPVSTPPPSTATSTPTSTPLPVVGDTIGVYKDGVFFLNSANDNSAPEFTIAFGGDPSDLPVVGDWNGDLVDTVGVYRGSTGQFFLSDSNTTPALSYLLTFGNPGDTPFAGRWDSLVNHDGVGVYRNTNGILYLKRQLTTGFDDYYMVFGNPGDSGFGGDWNGDGYASVGIYRPGNQSWYLNNINGNGITFAQQYFAWDISANRPVVGDWNADGVTTVGSFDPTGAVFTLHPTNTAGGTDNVFAFGPTGGYPVAGRWTAGSKPPPLSVGVIPGQTGYVNGGEGGAE